MLPSNEGRGYVLRRIMRRAMRHAELLGAKDPLMWKLVPVLVREMGTAYPELIRAEALITETLRLEERRFRKTLERGLAILDEETKNLSAAGSSRATPRSRSTTPTASRSTSRRTRSSRAASPSTPPPSTPPWRGSASSRAPRGRGRAKRRPRRSGLRLRDKVGATDFLGYETEDAEGVVQALIRDGSEVERLNKGESGFVVLNQTPFYGEFGGQVGDTGIMHADGVRVTRHRHAEDGGRRVRP